MAHLPIEHGRHNGEYTGEKGLRCKGPHGGVVLADDANQEGPP